MTFAIRPSSIPPFTLGVGQTVKKYVGGNNKQAIAISVNSISLGKVGLTAWRTTPTSPSHSGLSTAVDLDLGISLVAIIAGVTLRVYLARKRRQSKKDQIKNNDTGITIRPNSFNKPS
ncbi:MAG TPA: hypothetical protein VMR34_05645 [Candidatus Saccharimonadales bacterium]|nr:hypothetical protein [Candidatus Saccharimonadales bacterium]